MMREKAFYTIPKAKRNITFGIVFFALLHILFLSTPTLLRAQGLSTPSSSTDTVIKQKKDNVINKTFEIAYVTSLASTTKHFKGFTTGLLVNQHLTKRWGLQTELTLSNLKAKNLNSHNARVHYGTYTDSLSQQITIGNLYYLSVPVTLNYQLTNYWKIGLGPRFSILANTASTFTEQRHYSHPLIEDRVVQRKQLAYFNGLRTWDVGLTIGSMFNLGKRGFLSLRYHWMWNDVTENAYYQNNVNDNNSHFEVGLGYRFLKLGKQELSVEEEKQLEGIQKTQQQSRFKMGLIAGVTNFEIGAYSAGLVFDYNKIFQASIKYSVRNVKPITILEDAEYYEGATLVLSQEREETFNQLHYLEVPLMLKFNILDRFALMLGPQIALLANSQSIVREYENGALQAEYNTFGSAISELPPVDVALNIGSDFLLTKNFSINLNYFQSLIPITDNNHKRFQSGLQVSLIYYPLNLLEHPF